MDLNKQTKNINKTLEIRSAIQHGVNTVGNTIKQIKHNTTHHIEQSIPEKDSLLFLLYLNKPVIYIYIYIWTTDSLFEKTSEVVYF